MNFAEARHQTQTLPNFLLVGAMRSGTTALSRYLGAHPEIHMAPTKEVHFFDRNHERGLDWYSVQLGNPLGAKAVGEATQTYMYDQIALERMARALPDARCIAILRNPVDRAYSHYWLKRSGGTEPLSFEDALEAERDRLADGSMEARFSYSYVDRGRYVRQLKMLEALYPRDAIFVGLFEDMRSDAARFYADVCRFLAVSDTVVPANVGTPINSHRAYRSTGLRRVAKKLPRHLARVAGKLNATASVAYPPMDRATRQHLMQTFAADNAELARWLRRDLSEWT